MWEQFTWLTSQLWYLVQFWVALSLFARMWLTCLTKFFGPLSTDHRLNLEINREKFLGARLAYDALSHEQTNYFCVALHSALDFACVSVI